MRSAREVTAAMVGLHAFDRNQPFVLLEVTTYDRSFNALLEEERDLARALGFFFAPTPVLNDGNIVSASQAPNLEFRDQIIRNADVRVSQSEWPILYAYLNRTLLIVTTNEFTCAKSPRGTQTLHANFGLWYTRSASMLHTENGLLFEECEWTDCTMPCAPGSVYCDFHSRRV